MGSAARLVGIFLRPSPFLNTVAYTPSSFQLIFTPKYHCLLYFLSPAQSSKASPKKKKKTEFYFLDPESWGYLKKQPACCTPIFRSFLSGTDEGNSSNQLRSPTRHTQAGIFLHKVYLQENNQSLHHTHWIDIF